MVQVLPAMEQPPLTPPRRHDCRRDHRRQNAGQDAAAPELPQNGAARALHRGGELVDHLVHLQIVPVACLPPGGGRRPYGKARQQGKQRGGEPSPSRGCPPSAFGMCLLHAVLRFLWSAPRTGVLVCYPQYYTADGPQIARKTEPWVREACPQGRCENSLCPPEKRFCRGSAPAKRFLLASRLRGRPALRSGPAARRARDPGCSRRGRWPWPRTSRWARRTRCPGPSPWRRRGHRPAPPAK